MRRRRESLKAGQQVAVEGVRGTITQVDRKLSVVEIALEGSGTRAWFTEGKVRRIPAGGKSRGDK